MNFQLNESEITAGVRRAAELMGFDLEGKELTVDYSMGRGKNGLSAQVTITNPAIPVVAPSVVIKGFTDTDPAPTKTASPPKGKETVVEAEPEQVEVAEATAVGTDAATLFGDDE